MIVLNGNNFYLIPLYNYKLYNSIVRYCNRVKRTILTSRIFVVTFHVTAYFLISSFSLNYNVKTRGCPNSHVKSKNCERNKIHTEYGESFLLSATEKWRTYTTRISTSSHLLNNLSHLSSQLLRGTDWIWFWMLVKSLMDWSQWQNSYSNLMGPEIWFLTCINSSQLCKWQSYSQEFTASQNQLTSSHLCSNTAHHMQTRTAFKPPCHLKSNN